MSKVTKTQDAYTLNITQVVRQAPTRIAPMTVGELREFLAACDAAGLKDNCGVVVGVPGADRYTDEEGRKWRWLRRISARKVGIK